MGQNDFSLKLVGERYDNEDGSSRQDALADCAAGDRVDLVREPDNEHDTSAVAVFTEEGAQIGYLGADRSGWIGSKIDRGYDVRAIIGRIGRHASSGALAAVLVLNMDGEDPEVPIDEL